MNLYDKYSALIMYHNDADGRGAGAICYKELLKLKAMFCEKNIILREMSYDDKVPFELIDENTFVYILDYSIDVQDMVRLIKITPYIVWIDHHISAINKYKEADDMIGIDIDGIRLDGISGCMLTWLWFNVDNGRFSFEDNRDMIESFTRSNLVPDWIKYINDWDLWKFEYGDTTKCFHYGLELCINDLNDNDNIFFDLYDGIFGWRNDMCSIDDIVNKGESIYKYIIKSNQNLCVYNGFESKLSVGDKEYSVYVLNSANVSSDTFVPMNDYEYDFFVGFHQKDNNTFQYSLRKPINSNVDLSKIAEWFGGGGHKSASGFILDYNLFDCKHRWKESE